MVAVNAAMGISPKDSEAMYGAAKALTQQITNAGIAAKWQNVEMIPQNLIVVRIGPKKRPIAIQKPAPFFVESPIPRSR